MRSDDLILSLVQNPSFERWVLHPTAEDTAYWEEWLSDNPHYQEEVIQARAVVQGVSFRKTEVPPAQVEASWEKVARRTMPTPRRLPLFPVIVRYAATVSLLLLLGVGGWKGYIAATRTTYSTPYGSTQTIILEDGTQVVLNANSEIYYVHNWLEQPEREIFLKGEAYFSVTQRTQSRKLMPFVVHTSDLSIRVLGTEFNVNSRRGQTQVVLDEGEVALQIPESDETTMKPGEYVMYSSEDKKITRHRVNPEIYTSWRNQLLTLDDTPLGQIIRQLEDNYGVSIELSDEELKERKISSTGSIAAEDLDTILEALSALLEIRIERNSNTIYIYER